MVFSLCLSVSADDTSDVPLEVPSEEPTGEESSGDPDVSSSGEARILINEADSITVKDGSVVGDTNNSNNIKNDGTDIFDSMNTTPGNIHSVEFNSLEDIRIKSLKLMMIYIVH